MSQQPDNSSQVRRVVLPSGKTIEVVYIGDEPQALQELSPEAAARPAAGSGVPLRHGIQLHICCECDSRLVYPIAWDEASPTHWEVRLRCPNCEWSVTGVFEQQLVESFDEELDRGTEALVRDLKRLMHANMQDEIDRFVTALAADHIVPDDF